MKRSPTGLPQISGRPQKSAEDTAAGCRAFAEADTVRASLMDTENGRLRLEASAESWTKRAQLMQRMDDSFEARQAIAKAEWDAEEPAADRRNDPDSSAES